MSVWTAYSSSALLRLEKTPSYWGLYYFLHPKCFFLPNTNVLLHTDFFDQGSGKLSLIHTEATRSFSENTSVCFTVRFCHNYFLKAVVWRQIFWWVTIRCPGTAVTPLSFLKWKLRSSRAPQEPKPPSRTTLHSRALLGRGSCIHRGW